MFMMRHQKLCSQTLCISDVIEKVCLLSLCIRGCNHFHGVTEKLYLVTVYQSGYDVIEKMCFKSPFIREGVITFMLWLEKELSLHYCVSKRM